MKLLSGDSDWKVSADLKTSLQFPVYIIQTEKPTDIVAWSDSKKTLLRIELTVPWEENREDAHERKKNRPWFSRTFNHFVSFKNRNHWPQFESCLKSSSDHGATCIKLDLVESERF